MFSLVTKVSKDRTSPRNFYRASFQGGIPSFSRHFFGGAEERGTDSDHDSELKGSVEFEEKRSDECVDCV